MQKKKKNKKKTKKPKKQKKKQKKKKKKKKKKKSKNETNKQTNKQKKPPINKFPGIEMVTERHKPQGVTEEVHRGRMHGRRNVVTDEISRSKVNMKKKQREFPVIVLF